VHGLQDGSARGAVSLSGRCCVGRRKRRAESPGLFGHPANSMPASVTAEYPRRRRGERAGSCGRARLALQSPNVIT